MPPTRTRHRRDRRPRAADEPGVRRSAGARRRHGRPWWLLALLALQLALGLTLGRRWCLACLFYFEVLQPRLGEGPLEDARPPRFANMVGLGFLTAASLAYVVGSEQAGAALGGLVAALALLAAATGSARAARRTGSATA